jgi:hypothetical protein
VHEPAVLLIGRTLIAGFRADAAVNCPGLQQGRASSKILTSIDEKKLVEAVYEVDGAMPEERGHHPVS